MTTSNATSMPAPSRRAFLASTAGFTIAFALNPDSFIGKAEAASALPLNVWVSIAPDGIVTIASAAAEMGQGSFTTMPAILADELDADWSKVRLVDPPVWDEKIYGNPEIHLFNTTSSMATRGYYMSMRIAGAQARRVLIDAVAEKWSLPAAELSTEPGVVVHKQSGRRIGYGEIVSFAKAPAQLPKIDSADLKSPDQFRFIGKDVPRVDIASKVRGAAKYGIDVRVPDMVYAAVAQSPYHGGTPATVDDVEARKTPGVTDIIRLPAGVGVIGISVEATQAARQKLKIDWTPAPAAGLDSEQALAEFIEIARDTSREGVPYETVGDAKAVMKTADRIFRGDYQTRYVYHAQMEPINATASVSDDGQSVEIWMGTQNPSGLHGEVAKLLHIDRSKITFHQHLIGGGYGRRGALQDAVLDAALLSKAVKKPVKVVWSREDDMAFGKFRPMTAQHIEAGFDKDGKLIAWHHRVVAESVFDYRSSINGQKTPKNDVIVMQGTPLPHYPILNKYAEHVIEKRGARLSSLRGVGVACNAFAVESFVDEIAAALGKDPMAFRMEISAGNERAQTLLRTVEEMSDWHVKRDGRALGVAIMDKGGTLSAGVAEVSLDRASGKIRVHRYWVAIDAGRAIQPRNIAAQTEGGVVFGLGIMLREKITIKEGHVLQSNYTDYEVPRMSDVPEIEVRVISTDNPPTGAGEDGVPLVACTVGNAIAAMTGVRLRELPFDAERVKKAMQA